MPQVIGVPREVFPGEKRVATVPDVVPRLAKLGFGVIVQSGAGEAASISDPAYEAAGARIVADAASTWSGADIIFKVRAPTLDEVRSMRDGQVLVSFIWPAQNPELLQALAAKKVTVLAMDSVPRISRAQKLDALSSMANIGGYRAVIEAAHEFGRFFTGQITAAGKVPPAKVFVIGAGVAGLAAIGAAAGLGAIVRANDTRPEVADQIKSLGGEYVPVDYVEEGTGVGGYAKVMSEGFQKALRQAGEGSGHHHHDGPHPRQARAAPHHRRNGAFDESRQCDRRHGGRAGRQLRAHRAGQSRGEARRHPHRIHGPAQPARHTVEHALRQQPLPPGRGTLQGEGWRGQREHGRRGHSRHHGDQGWRRHVAAAKKAHGHGAGEPMKARTLAILFGVAAVFFWVIGAYAPTAFLGHFTVFVLACFVGYMVVWNVTPALHTPLMSVTNAISSIIIIGALVQIAPLALASGAGPDTRPEIIRWLAVAGIALTAINMIGGFAVTQRMLSMFRK